MAAMAGALLGALFLSGATVDDTAVDIIVQAEDAPAAAAAARAVGAEVTGELGIIRAAAVRATPAERRALARSEPVRRIWENHAVTLASGCSISGQDHFSFDDRKIKWSLTNQSGSDRWLENLVVQWPAANGDLKKVKLAGDIVRPHKPAPLLVVNGLWDGSRNDRKLKAGETKALEIEFMSTADVHAEDYLLRADFGGGCEVVFAPATSCPLSSDMVLEVSGSKVKWELSNDGDRTLWLDDLMVEWPAENGAIEKIKFNGDVFTRLAPPSSLAVGSSWDGDVDDRRLDPGHSETLEIEFTEDADRLAGRYFIEAEFGPTCSLVLTPGQGGGTGVTPFAFSRWIGADRLHLEGVTGEGVSVAIVDTGIWTEGRLKKNRHGSERILAGYNVLERREGVDKAKDENGHGTHLASIVSNSELFDGGLYAGVAPDSETVVVQAFDEEGRGAYTDAIAGLDWVLAHKDEFNIRVVNLSFSAPPQSHYWDDPLDQAVMELWRAGLVVVVSAGNGGPEPMTVGVPGNVPYVITVGAVSDAVTPYEPGDDFLASFSAAGPTHEGFVKPDVVAPGGHVRGIMNKDGRIGKRHPEFHDTGKYFVMSGTSQAAAVVSGAVALMLEAEPGLTPDEVKCRLMASARPAVDADGNLAYSIFQQGAGLVDVYDAVHSSESGCANQGLDIDADLAGIEHYGGGANMDEAGNYYIEGVDGYLWGGGYIWGNGYIWGTGYVWGTGYIWGTGYVWGTGYLWGTSVPWWDEEAVWSSGLVEPASINVWVEQE
jgi:subtilisin family serine protease